MIQLVIKQLKGVVEIQSDTRLPSSSYSSANAARNTPKPKPKDTKGSSNTNRKQALNQAKDLAEVPRSQQPSRQWTVGDDTNKKGVEFRITSMTPILLIMAVIMSTILLKEKE